ncbi:anaerobic ribonucleoside-triphosphate reductase activating protein [Serpentinicella sp. ANB-PHB4]|uniref:anaerobic ribonucleoside-triphosphate reductase activating protein n=1 Tax=Serpentinicella sp. ANB-PHB4 TaxID=3074076 RepID=UPI00285A0F93|nr:anaerobic ribonucleoside-triphosphate reductase activating protein [Serpentinicella sp. ANB-PHB4]MDR5659406.1 anaerobic ribonucleoside-triphosphate reductase activating protein [Serpentinicella sp. ANB-PHB4]
MNIKGIQKSSFIDYPDKISTVYFVGGCNFRCPYCHNRDLVNNRGEKIDESEVLNFIKQRKKFIDAICISGGEPTLQPNLCDFISKVKDEGFFVKLDTNGTKPDILKHLLDHKLIDYIAMDIKAPLEKYSKVAGAEVDVQKIKKSIQIVKDSDINYEFRTTVCKALLTKEDILNIGKMLEGSKKYCLQNFKDGEGVLCGENKLSSFDSSTMKELESTLKPYFEEIKIR